MTHSDFNHLLSSIKALSPAQMRRLRQQLDAELAHPVPRAGSQPQKSPGRSPAKVAKRTKSTPTPAKPPSIEELHRKMMARGLIRRLPDPSLDIDDDDPDDQPVAIKGEPLSETILRERR